MKSCLESTDVTPKQQKQVAMAIIRDSPSLAHDPNGVIVIQWLIDSELPGRFGLIVDQLGQLVVPLASSKHASNIVAKLVQQTSEPSVRETVLDHLLFSNPNVSVLLQDPMASAIILKALMIVRIPTKLRIAKSLNESLKALGPLNLAHLVRLSEEVANTLQDDLDGPVMKNGTDQKANAVAKISFGSLLK